MKEKAELFKVFAVDTRIKILELLKNKGSMFVNEIADALGVTQSAVSQHLRILKHARLVTDKREGYWIRYSLDEKALERCRQELNQVCSCGCTGQDDIPGRRLLDNLGIEELEEHKASLLKELEGVEKRIIAIKERDHSAR